jgi:hypothetical protein
VSTDDKLSFAQDVRPMFTDLDVDHMRKLVDLSNRDSVFAQGAAIYATVSSGKMPPASSGEPHWTDEMCSRFKKWLDQGGPA